jgi:hypothetical protein
LSGDIGKFSEDVAEFSEELTEFPGISGKFCGA